jgi:hypothetical protein
VKDTKAVRLGRVSAAVHSISICVFSSAEFEEIGSSNKSKSPCANSKSVLGFIVNGVATTSLKVASIVCIFSVTTVVELTASVLMGEATAVSESAVAGAGNFF